MGKKYLIDTNVVSKTLRGLFPNSGLAFVEKIISSQLNISVITRIELLGWKPEDAPFALDLAFLVQQANEFTLDEAVILRTIELRKTIKIKLPDAIIAATALVHNLTLVSDNDADFLKVPKLKYTNPARLSISV